MTTLARTSQRVATARATPPVEKFGLGGACTLLRCAAGIAVLVMSMALPGCGGGKTPTTPRPPTTTPSVTFVADASNPGTDAIALTMTSSTVDTFTLALLAFEVADLFGYGVDITFDPAVVMFETATAGTFLDGEGITVTSQIAEGPSGTLVIGQSRVGAVVGMSGSGTLLSLIFKSVAAGTSTFTTSNAGAFDSTGAAMTTQFFGGTATVPSTGSR